MAYSSRTDVQADDGDPRSLLRLFPKNADPGRDASEGMTTPAGEHEGSKGEQRRANVLEQD